MKRFTTSKGNYSFIFKFSLPNFLLRDKYGEVMSEKFEENMLARYNKSESISASDSDIGDDTDADVPDDPPIVPTPSGPLLSDSSITEVLNDTASSSAT